MIRRPSTARESPLAARPAPTLEPLAYSLEDAGKALGGVSVPTLHRWIRAGRLRTAKIGGRTLVRRAELERVLEEGEISSAA